MIMSKDEIALQQWIIKQDDFMQILKSKVPTSSSTVATDHHHNNYSSTAASTTIFSKPSLLFHVHLHRFGYGQSNPTYRLDIILNDTATSTNNNNINTTNNVISFVLRQKPYKIAHPSAHAIHREYRVLQSIQKFNNDIIQQQQQQQQKEEEEYNPLNSFQYIPIPNVYIYCNDNTIIGSEFYIMEYINGRIFTDPTLPELKSNHDRMIAYHQMIQVLANIHSIPYEQYQLNNYGSNSNSSSNNKLQNNKNTKSYVERQLERLISVSKQQTKLLLSSSSSSLTNDKESSSSSLSLSKINENNNDIYHLSKLLLQYCNENPIKNHINCLIHGDYKIDNIIFHKTKPIIIGIIDWELSTIGDPYCDLANISMMYYTPRYTDNHNNHNIDNSNNNSNNKSKNEEKEKNIMIHTAIHQGFGQLNKNDLYELGIPNRYDLIQYYCKQYNNNHNNNRMMNDILIIQWSYFYLSFLFFKNCIIVQGVQQRIQYNVASNISLNVNELLPQLIVITKLLLKYHNNNIEQEQEQKEKETKNVQQQQQHQPTFTSIIQHNQKPISRL